MSHPIFKYCPRCAAVLESRFLFNRERPACPACGFIYFEDPKVAAGALVEKEGKILLVRRLNEPAIGKWSFPGGFVDAHEDPAEAACREVFEETGLVVQINDLAHLISGREHPLGADIVLVYHCSILGGELHPADDADRAEFFAWDALPPLAFRATRVALGLVEE